MVVDKAPVSEVAFDSFLIKAITGDGDLRASVDESAADGGLRLGFHFTRGVRLALADGVQLHGCVVADIGGSVLRLDGSIDVCPVMGGNIRIVDCSIGTQCNVLFAGGIHVGTQSGSLGVSLTIDVELADVGNDVDYRTLNNGLVRGIDGNLGCEGNGVLDLCVGGCTQAGGIGTANAVNAILRAVRSDGHGAKPIPNLSGSHGYSGSGSHIHDNFDFRDIDSAIGINFRIGSNDISPTCLGNDIQLAEVGLDNGTIANHDRHRAHQTIRRADLSCRNEGLAILGGSCRHSGIGDCACREVGIGIHRTLKLNIIVNINGIITLGDIQIDDTAIGGVLAGYDTLRGCIVLSGDADAAQLGNQLGTILRISVGRVVAYGRKGLFSNIANDRNIRTGADIGLRETLIVSTDDDILLCLDRAAGNSGPRGLTVVTGADTRSGIGLAEADTGHAAAGFGEGIRSGGRHTLNAQAVNIHMNAGQVRFDRIVGVSIAAHIVEGYSRNLIWHTAAGIRAGDRTGKDLNLSRIHGIAAAAADIGIVGANRPGFRCGGVCTYQLNRIRICTIGRLPAGSIGGAVVGIGIVAAAVDEGFHRHIAGGKAAGVMDIGLLLHLQIGIYIRNRHFSETQAQPRADALGLGNALACDVNGHRVINHNIAAGAQGRSAGIHCGIGIDFCLRQVYRAIDQGHIHALTRSGGLGIGNGGVAGQDFQGLRGDILTAIFDVSLEAAAGGCLADKHAEGCQPHRSVASAVVGLGNGLAQGLNGELSGRVHSRILNPGLYRGAGIGNGRVGIDGERGNLDTASVTLAAASNDCAGAGFVGILIEAGMDADVLITGNSGILDVRILLIQQPCLHEVHSQACRAQRSLGSIEACTCIRVTSQGNCYIPLLRRRVSLLRGRVILHFPAGNTCLGCDAGIRQSHIDASADQGGAQARPRLGAHGLCSGGVGIADTDRFTLDLLIGGVAHIGTKVTAGVGINLGQEHRDQSQLDIVHHIALGKGTACGIEVHGAGNIQIGIVNIAVVCAPEPGIGRIGGRTDNGNRDTGVARCVAAADGRQGTAELVNIVEHAVRIEAGVHGEVIGLQCHVLNQGFLGNIYVRRCHIGGDFHLGTADRRCIDDSPGLGLAGSGYCHVASDIDHTAGSLPAQDAGSGPGQIPCRRHIHLDIGQGERYTAYRRGDLSLGITDIVVGDGQTIRTDVCLTIIAPDLGLNQCLEGSLRVGIAGMKTNGYETESKACNVCHRSGFSIVGNGDGCGNPILRPGKISAGCMQILRSEMGSAGGIGNGVRRTGRCGQRTGTRSKHQSLCHGGKVTLQFIVTAIQGDGQIKPTEVKAASAGLLDGADGHRIVDCQCALAIHFGFLHILQVCHRHRDLRA